MAHEIYPGPNSHIVVMRYRGALTAEDLSTDKELGLDQKPFWMVLDASEMDVALPENFLTSVRESFFVHPNMRHLSLVLHSSLLKTVAVMVGKITHRQDRLSVFDDYDAALANAVKLVSESKAVR